MKKYLSFKLSRSLLMGVAATLVPLTAAIALDTNPQEDSYGRSQYMPKASQPSDDHRAMSSEQYGAQGPIRTDMSTDQFGKHGSGQQQPDPRTALEQRLTQDGAVVPAVLINPGI